MRNDHTRLWSWLWLRLARGLSSSGCLCRPTEIHMICHSFQLLVAAFSPESKEELQDAAMECWSERWTEQQHRSTPTKRLTPVFCDWAAARCAYDTEFNLIFRKNNLNIFNSDFETMLSSTYSIQGHGVMIQKLVDLFGYLWYLNQMSGIPLYVS